MQACIHQMIIMTERKVLHWERRGINQEERKENRSHEEIESKVG